MNTADLGRAGLALMLAFGAPTAGAEEWRQTILVYGMGAAIDGETQVGDLVVPVDASIADVFDALEFGAMGAWRADNGTWSITGDATYMGLGGTSRSERGLVRGDVDVDQFTLMTTLGRRVAQPLEALFSLAYFDLAADLEVRTTAPITGAVTRRTAETDVSWVDPMVGLHYAWPFSETWTLNLRGDVGGFGIGSDLSYQLLGSVRWQSGGNVGAVFGYRLISFEYEDGHRGTQGYERFDLTEQGPMIGMTWAF